MTGRAQGSFGSRNGEVWRQSDAIARRRRDVQRGEVDGAGVAYSVTPPSLERMRAAIESETCPFCGAGPYLNLGLHTNRNHGVSAAELREMAGLKRVCAEALSDKCRDSLVSRVDFAEISQRGNEAAMKAGAQSIAAAASLAARLALMAERDPEICRRAASGEPLADIARAFGIAYNTVHACLVRHGIEPSLEQTNAARRARLTEHRAAAKATREQNHAIERTERLARFDQLGGDWAAMHTLADEIGVSPKSMTDYLKKAGVVLPDGRAVSAKRGGPRPALRGIPNRSARAASDEQIREIQRLSQSGVSQAEIAEQFGIGKSTISRILAGKYVG